MIVKRTRGIIYMPLEIVTREYAGKLLVALEMAARGFYAVIGHKGAVNKSALNTRSPGIYFYKSAGMGMKSRPDFLKKIIKRGFITVAQDEEAGIAYLNFSDFYARRPGLKGYGKLDAFFCWGRDDYEFLAEKHPESKEKLYITGAPRTFLWTPEGAAFHKNEVDFIKRRYNGQYVLFVSNFAGANSAKGKIKHAEQIVKRFGSSPRILNQIQQRLQLGQRLTKQFAKGAVLVHETYGVPVVMRPHPGENWQIWKDLVKDHPGIHVETEYDLISWIRGARVVIQNGCTSAIEARCAKSSPVLAYAEHINDIANETNGFPNLIAKQVVGSKALIHALGELDNIWSEFLKQSPDSVLDRKVVRPPEGSPRVIADIITSLAENAGGLYSSDLPVRPGRVYSGLNRARKSIKKMIFKMDTPSRISKNKRRPITFQQVIQDVGRAADALSLDGDAFFVRELYDNSFLIGLR